MLLFGRLDVETLKVEDSGPKNKKRKFSSDINSVVSETKLMKTSSLIDESNPITRITYSKKKES